ncbi:triose-phosphate isomerase [SAR86 cluster bacterium]|nr:triose-phosphate isomerase [SAR86 cluster bacterium]
MNLPTPDIRSWTENFYSNVNLDDSKTIGVAPPFTHISNCVTYLQNLRVGAQNISSRDLGNNTGEISASIAKDSGASFVILGHSEVRENLDEQSSLINKKIAIAIEKNLSPVVCFGESRESYENGITKDFVCSQLKECFEGIKAETIIIAYEPIWSIGTGITPETNEINEIHNTIKDYCKNHLKFVPESVLYGGSVTDKNCKNLITGENIDGFLVGGASLDGNSFARIVNNCF